MDIQKTIANKLSSKIKEQVGHRVDLVVADLLTINQSTARFMLEFEGKHPSSEEITDFFTRKFSGKVSPDMSTAKLVPSENVIVVVANMVNYHRPITDSSKMTQVVAGYSYFDENLQESWIVKDVNGTKVLARKLKDDISSIVEARKKVMMEQSKKTFASLKATANIVRSIALVEEGDIVHAYHNGCQYDNCVVVKAGAEEVELKHESKTLKTNKSAVLEVVAKASELTGADQNKLIAYYTKAYGDAAYAKKLVKG